MSVLCHHGRLLIYWFVLIGSLSLFGLCIRPHLCMYFVLPPIVLLHCLSFCYLRSVSRVLVLCSGLPVDSHCKFCWL